MSRVCNSTRDFNERSLCLTKTFFETGVSVPQISSFIEDLRKKLQLQLKLHLVKLHTFSPDGAFNFLYFKRLCTFACNIVVLMGGLEFIHLDNLYLLVLIRSCWDMFEDDAP